ncbi:MAG: outer membrane beta-barrel protein [Acidobacteria bacterium]|nr:outer membrane beta-barrel protein [Acidobacteriota bacterium]
MTGARSAGFLTVSIALAALAGGALAAPYSTPHSGRAGHGELLFGLGSMTSDSARLDPNQTLDAGDGTTFDVRFQFHFNDNIGIQIDAMGERESTTLREFGFLPDKQDTSTGFLFANFLFDFVPSPVTPYVAVGVGSFSHRGLTFFDLNNCIAPNICAVVTTRESGSAFDAAFGFEGHSRGPLCWAAEAKYIYYEFSNFQESWNRYQFSGHLGFRF